MSIFLKPGVMKVRGDDDEFTSINILAEESKDEYLDAIEDLGESIIDDIEDLGEDTIGDIEDKGTEVLESIPSDYTEVLADLAQKAYIDGSYESMTVGNAEQIVSTIYEEDSVPYHFRTSGGSIDIGDREEDMVVGGTIVWNQQLMLANAVATYEKFGLTVNARTDHFGFDLSGSFSYSSGDRNMYIYNPQPGQQVISGHKYLFTNTSKYICAYFYGVSGSGISFTGNITNISNQGGGIVTPDGSGGFMVSLHCGSNIQNETAINETIYIDVFDLTQMFGSTIADYIYSLEQATAGAGVAWFKKLFPKDYYAYDAGSLQHVSALSSHDMVGFNAWDEEWEVGGITYANGTKNTQTDRIRTKNYIRILPNTTYYCNELLYVFFYDNNKTFISYQNYDTTTFTTPSNAGYILFFVPPEYGTTYNHDICLNLSWDGERDGEYEPYVKHSYPLDSTLTLRGIPKLDSNNKLYYDGDTYESDGTVTRKYGVVDLGTLDWLSDQTRTDVKYTGSLTNLIMKKSPWADAVCSEYELVKDGPDSLSNGQFGTNNSYGAGSVFLKDSELVGKTGVEIKEYLSGVYLVYELATPTTETADPYQNPQIVDDFGTEQYVTTSIVPVGHYTKYQPNLRAKLEMAPNSPDANGDYILRHYNGENSYVELLFPADELPAPPSTDGSFTLKCTVSDGTATYTWEADT